MKNAPKNEEIDPFEVKLKNLDYVIFLKSGKFVLAPKSAFDDFMPEYAYHLSTKEKGEDAYKSGFLSWYADEKDTIKAGHIRIEDIEGITHKRNFNQTKI